jgi:2-polyprenyl-6-methoxyphenol hydroxylase-like FAD-dependent oxidoreductase
MSSTDLAVDVAIVGAGIAGASVAYWLTRLDPTLSVAIVERAVATHVARQCAWTDGFNRDLERGLADRGMVFNTADVGGFRRALSAEFYQRSKERFGRTAWSLLEDAVGRLG